ncbi:MAG: indole-3-glycerol-phosphate synthase [Deltaproteobacteria bacterium]|nr:MAG: indole-3-glycerol-phosphate synthase [Deltaproteobacteria bacterium]
MLRLREPPGVLGKIVARTVRELPEGAPGPRRASSPRPFAEALRAPGLSLIAELKPRSPSEGDLRPSVSPEDVAPAYRHAAAISVLIDGPSFGGSLDLLARMRSLVDRPVLAKGFFISEVQVRQAWSAGADAVLLMASILPPPSLEHLLGLATDLGLGALVEAHDARELEEVLASGAEVIGVNSRDLTRLSIDLGRAATLLATVPTNRVRVAESGLHTRADVDRIRGVADAALIGTALMTSPDPAARIAELGLRSC